MFGLLFEFLPDDATERAFEGLVLTFRVFGPDFDALGVEFLAAAGLADTGFLGFFDALEADWAVGVLGGGGG